VAGVARDHPQRYIVVEPVGLVAVGAERTLIEKFLHAGRGLETSGAHEGAERRIDRVRAVAAAPQRRGQPALYPAGGNLRHIISEAPERARRETRKHVVLAVPARTARPFNNEVPGLAVER